MKKNPTNGHSPQKKKITLSNFLLLHKHSKSFVGRSMMSMP